MRAPDLSSGSNGEDAARTWLEAEGAYTFRQPNEDVASQLSGAENGKVQTVGFATKVPRKIILPKRGIDILNRLLP